MTVSANNHLTPGASGMVLDADLPIRVTSDSGWPVVELAASRED